MRRLIPLLLLLLLAGCSFQQVIDRLVSPERQRAIMTDAQHLCTEPAAILPRIDVAIRDQSAQQLASQGATCVDSDTWRLTTFRFNTASDGSGNSSRQEFAVVVGGAGPWTEIMLQYDQRNDEAMRIIAWQILPSAEEPASLAYIRTWSSAAKWGVWIGGAAVLIIGFAIWWMVRDYRRKRALWDANKPPDHR